MDEYRHHVTGIFAHHQVAENALSMLVDLGLPRERLYIMKADSPQGASVQQADSNGVLTHVLVDGVIGTAVGAA